MQRDARYIRIDVCDYNNKPLCNLYDSDVDSSGQAFEVYTNSQRNGFKELSFQLPSVCMGEEGEERNYRLDYLISDYRIKLQRKPAGATKTEIDWFLISENKVTHSNFSEAYDIRASHISQLLNTKKMDLEFSDNEGNNVGTIAQLAETIIEGTGWHLGYVAKFYEEKKFDQTQSIEKVRSFTAAAQTGAFKMMNSLCELFDAKPIYHGESEYEAYDVEGTFNGERLIYKENCDYYEAQNAVIVARDEGWTDLGLSEPKTVSGRTVDIIPMNPFSEDFEEGTVPLDLVENKILELYYDKNVKGITRTQNTENIVTKLSAYGSYGDRTGLCSLQKASHEVLCFTDVSADTEYKFTYNNANYYFTTDSNVSGNVYWSTLDYTSRSYVYFLSGESIEIYPTYRKPNTDNPIIPSVTVSEEINNMPFIMDFSYYRKIGLFTDEMLKVAAEYQYTLPDKYIAAEEASLAISDARAELFETASVAGGFLKFDISSGAVVQDSGNINYNQLVLTLNKTNYPDGVIYRSDYAEAKRNRFTWAAAEGLKDSGMAINGIGSVVYIIQQNPNSGHTEWTKAYVKMIGNGTDNYFYDRLGNYYTLHVREAYDRKQRKETDEGTVTQFPDTGVEGVIYVALDTGKTYIWSDGYIEIYAASYSYGLRQFDEPSTVTLWCGENVYNQNSIVYMFSSDSIAGMFGPREDAVYANRESIEKSIETGTSRHPVYFIEDNDPAPSEDLALLSYGWYYRSYSTVDPEHPEKYTRGDLYFCYGKRGKQARDNHWREVFVSNSGHDPEVDPDVQASQLGYGYYYSIRKGMLYYSEEGTGGQYTWKPFDKDSTDDKNVMAAFMSVIVGCIKQEVLTKGVYETYTYNVEGSPLPVGNYAFKNEFGNYWLFTTDMQVPEKIVYDNTQKVIWQDDDEHHILKPKEYTYSVLDFPVENELSGITFTDGSYDATKQTFTETGDNPISHNVYVHETTNYVFRLPAGSIVVCLNTNAKYVDSFTIANNNPQTIYIPHTTSYVRIVCPEGTTIDSTYYVRVEGYENSCFVKDDQYIILDTISGGERTGIYALMDKFIELAETIYTEKLPALLAAQRIINQANLDMMNTFGDMYREGTWREEKYAEGDENKLYSDALDNLKEIAKPETTYEVEYLELYGSDKNVGLSVDGTTEEVEYPDIDITWAAHLIDTDIDTNCWAYIDSINVCHDKTWQTTIEINTKLSVIGQQNFTDVLTNIADVANQTKAKQSIYGRAEALSSSGKLAGERLEGTISANTIYLLGGTSNWRTDDKGNIIFESADGESAMMLTGRGLMISQQRDTFGDWEWRTAMTGQGMTADSIYTGYLSAERIEAGSITADKLNSSVGNELEIGSNVALSLYATESGSRPSGALVTPHESGDSYITINAKQGDNPASIDIMSGGNINIDGGHINIESGGGIRMSANSLLDVSAGSINIHSGGDFLIDTPYFRITKDEITGEHSLSIHGQIDATSGQIAGFTVDHHTADPQVIGDYTYTYMYAGQTQTVSQQVPGVYLGSDGINLGGKLRYKYAQYSGDSSYLYVTAESIDIQQTNGQTVTSTFSASNGNIAINAAANINLGASTININAASSISIAASSSISIASGEDLTITSNGNLKIGKTGKLFTVGGNNVDAYILNGMTELSDITHNGVYIGTDGIALGQGKFKVTDQGALSATSGSIAGWTIDEYGLSYRQAPVTVRMNSYYDVQDPDASHQYILYIARDPVIQSGSFSVEYFAVDDHGNVIATNLNAISIDCISLTVNGQPIGTQESSITSKHSVEPLSYQEDAIDKISAVSFIYNNDSNGTVHLGFIAEEVEEVYPEVCSYMPNGIKGINYTEFIPILADEIKKLRKRVSELEKGMKE